jgi:hypothetical protein
VRKGGAGGYLSRGLLCRFEFGIDQPEGGVLPVVRAEGALGKGLFSFSSGMDGALFSCTYYDDAEDMFHQFALVMAAFRKTAGFRPAYIDAVYDIDAETPPISAANYKAYTGPESRNIQKLLRERFAGICAREVCGKFAFVVYNENSPAIEGFCQQNIPVYQRLLGEFQKLYNVKGASLLFVRAGRRRFVLFYVKDKGLFHCTGDGSALFLKKEGDYLTELLQITPDYALAGGKSRFTDHFYEYREADGDNWALFVDGRKTNMRISMSYMLKGSLPVSNNLRPVCFARGGDEDGKEGMRQYESLDAAFKCELERALDVARAMNNEE